MKFSLKLLLCTIMLLAASLGFSGYYFVNYVFETSLKGEVEQAMDESNILRFAFETAALNVPMKYNILQNSTIEQVASNLEKGGQGAGRLIRLCDEEKKLLYASDGFWADWQLLNQTTEGKKTYRIVKDEKTYYVHTATEVNALDRVLYLETMQDISKVFDERALGFQVYQNVTIAILAAGTVIMYMISSLLTKPIRILAGATKRMAKGEYGYRADLVSKDELGELTKDFNDMAKALEENMKALEEEIQAREDFVAAFAHELKTPLTAIIGYADVLRSRKLEEEQSFMSANYIYTEGKRLEAMSFRLLDLMVTKQSKVEAVAIQAESVFLYLKNLYSGTQESEVKYEYDQGILWAEENLIKTVLVNLLDNARNASHKGGVIEVKGKIQKEGYLISIKDYGIGIPKEEQKKILRPFYMVDKSRSRSRNGAGLGLSLCVEILKLHKSQLQIDSEPGKGTCISFFLTNQEGSR